MPLMRKLAKSNPTTRLEIIKNSDACFLKILVELAKNVLKGNVKLSSTQLRKLKPHVHTMLKLTRTPKKSEHPSRSQKGVLETQGGFLPIILPALISALGTVAGKAVSKLID